MAEVGVSRTMPTVLTIGHSTHPLDVFLSLLARHAVRCVADVRTVPRSRHNPQFNKETLPGDLESHGVAYAHMAGLGGLRRERADSGNMGWRNKAFRGYADYMETEVFEGQVQGLVSLAGRERVAVMCAEALPWRCHRSLIADALVARGVRVEHIMPDGTAHPHQLTPFAHVEGTKVTYPAP